MTIDLRERSAPLLAAPPSRPQSRPSTSQQSLVLSLVAVSAIGAALFSDASPAGIVLADMLYRSAFAGLVVWFAARSRRWTWPILAGLAALATTTLIGQVVSIAALAGSARAVRQRRRDRFVGAVVAAVCMPALLTQGANPIWRLTGGAVDDPFASSALLTCLATFPIIGSGWSTISRRKRQVIKRWMRAAALATAGVVLVTFTAAMFAMPAMLRGLESNRSAMTAATDGELSRAGVEFDAAAAEWARANQYLSGPWMVPGRLLPIVGQHVRAGQIVTGQASAVSSAASAAATRIRPDRLVLDGAINLDEVDALSPAVDALAATTTRATDRIDAARSPWLLPQLSTRVERAVELVGRTAGVTSASAEALRVGSTILGGDAPSQILIMASTPAEARGSGGFVGNWALLEAVDGRISLVQQYQSRELNELLEEHGANLVADADYTSRYGRYDVERHIQDVTLSPDFPSVAQVAANLFGQATGHDVDAVLLVDPFVVEQLLGFTGPLDAGGATPLGGQNAAEVLLVEQYATYADDERAREAHLLGLTGQLIDALFDAPPDPLAFATELAPLAEQKRVALWLADDADGSIVERLGLSGAFPKDGEVLAVVHQNAAQNKIDPYLDRTVDIRSVVSPDARRVDHDVTITLDNAAPSDGLPDAVLASNDQSLARGTNRLTLSVYATATLTSARIDGVAAPVEADLEFGMSVYSFVIAIPPGDFTTLQLEFSDTLTDARSFDLTLGAQPLSAPDRVSWRLSTDDGSQVDPPPGWTRSSDGARWAAQLDRTEDFRFDFAG